MNSRDRFHAVLDGRQPDRLPFVPISMMAAADVIGVPYKRYATDYREHVRGQIAYAEKFGVDHVSAISDPATEAADCGAAVIYHDHQPPALDEERAVLAEKSALSALTVPDPRDGARMSNRLRVVEELASQVGDETIVEGWVEGPIAEASDLRGINRFMMDLFDDERFVRDLLELVFEMEMRYAGAQVEAGADVIGIGDAACSLIGGALYERFALEYHVRFVTRIHELGALARLHICGDCSFVLPHLPQIGADVMDLDSMVSVADARTRGGADQVLTGNIDPVRVLKEGSPEAVTSALADCYHAADRRAYMIAAGCEIPRGTPDENVRAMARFARSANSPAPSGFSSY